MSGLKDIVSQHKHNLSFKLTKYLIYKLFFASLLKQGNKTKARLKLSKINYFLKKIIKNQSPQHLVYLAVNNLRPPL
jgi:hypothetical protein